jgi:hypothetical protein
MKTFYQFLETIEKNELENKPNPAIRSILEQIKDKKDIVKFALYCAKDCFKFNDNVTRGPATNCINLVRKWLKDPKSVTDNDLSTAGYFAVTAYNLDDGNNNIIAYDAVYAASYAADAATGVYATHAASDASSAAASAIQSFYHANNRNRPIRQQKENEYRSYALSLLRTSNLMHKDENEDKEVEKQKNSFTNQFFSKKSKLTNRFNIMGLLDMLEEKGEDLVQHIGNELHLNIPNGITITAKDKNELVDKIWKNKAVLHYLEKLYR